MFELARLYNSSRMFLHDPSVLRRIAVLTLAAFALAMAPGCDRRGEGVAASGDPLAQHGRWLVINYWAEWCAPCLEEIPELNAFSREHAGRARVLLVNFDGVRGDQLRAQAKKLGIETELLEEDPAARLGLAAPQALPSTFLIAPDGKPAGVLLGPQSREQLERATGLGGDS
jgi:thiol-disulfide isomerase/thioredoxin